jgi:hypothetical protein
VQCGLTALIVDNRAQSHVVFDVLRLKDGQPFFRAYDIRRFNRQDNGMLTNRSLQPWPPPRPEPHSTVAHELGHSLNLHHSNRHGAGCVGGNERICYGAPGTPQRRNLMGAGNEVTTANAHPWLRAIFHHSQSLVWDTTDQLPKEMHFLR